MNWLKKIKLTQNMSTSAQYTTSLWGVRTAIWLEGIKEIESTFAFVE